MKRLFIITALLMCLNISAQDKRFVFNIYTELPDKNTHNDTFDYGFNIGVAIEYQMELLFFNAEVFYMPGLNGVDYGHFQATLLGFNHHSRFEKWRYYLGLIKPGMIFRGGAPYSIIGSDVGVEHYFKNDLYIGLQGSYDWRTDDKMWNPKGEGHGTWSFGVKFGIIL